jgi:peptide/nickel transport system substrate-binding protein
VSEIVTRAASPVADSWVPPNYDIRSEIESAIPQYLYDIPAAQRALEDLGWVRGADGTLRNAQGEQLRFEVRSVASARTEKEQNTAIIGWKLLGIEVDQLIRPASAVADEETRATYPGIELAGGSYDELFDLRLSCTNIPAASNGWRGRNSSGWCNQEAEGFIQGLQVTIPESERVQLMRGLVRVAMTEVAVMPMYWDLDPILAVAGVTGLPTPSAPGRVHTWNVWEWDRA